MDPAEHSAGALIQEEHDVSHTSENILVPRVGRRESSCLSGECGSVSGMDEIFLNRDGGSIGEEETEEKERRKERRSRRLSVPKRDQGRGLS